MKGGFEVVNGVVYMGVKVGEDIVRDGGVG